jgi:hypothetical protein
MIRKKAPPAWCGSGREVCTLDSETSFKEGIVSTLQRIVLAVLVLSGSASIAAQTPLAPGHSTTGQVLEELVATQNFQQHVDDYVVLHQLLEVRVPPVRVTTDVGEIQWAVRALGMRIQAARANARQGDIITPEAARMFKRRIATCLTPDEWEVIFADRARDEEGEPVQPPPLSVNMEWPAEVTFDYVPPQLLQLLPTLPKELHYRIIGRALVLWDHHANLIVDFLPGAFVPTT